MGKDDGDFRVQQSFSANNESFAEAQATHNC
jgi:hypothetical protein